MTLPVRERQVRLLADSRASEPRARLAQASSRAEFMLRLSRTVSAVQHPTRAMEALVTLLVEEMVTFAQVTVFSGIRQATVGVVHDGSVRTVAGLAVDAPTPLVDEVVRHGVVEHLMLAAGDERRALVDQLVPDPGLAEALDALGPESLVVLPLASRGRSFGALALARPPGYGFDAGSLAFLEDLAQRISVALDANLVVAESRHVAAVLRRAMTPARTRTVPDLDTAAFLRVAHEHEELGGDFYDVHGADDDLTLLLGDVAGKGVEAAVHAKRIRNAVRTASHVDRDPAWILALVNRVLCDEAEPDSEVIATAVCGRLRRVPDGLSVELANAGHPSPLVLRSDGAVERVEAGGVALALLDGTTYAATSVVLRPDDTLLLYTDGVTEARGHRDLFGEERLVSTLRQAGGMKASAVVDQVAIAVTTHLADRQRDDIALVALRFHPEQP
ncbi:GAF domain-containing protein [Nocardioides guangzhouensis]|uniref:GAF domain-containing protein n=1 Tax=Nocardioides guangzhouensis TaxID=2497878 RepID=A0A4Q4ZKP3_9ACTN|nr:SpoIIE family protein phosphatase [Nocardioides guangzhouensis]RYP88942.1 GAF domain-containing protein [Nocardioides guangzhouensis]